jgi:hypothetical protein
MPDTQNVKNVSHAPIDLSDGRLIPVGRVAKKVDANDPVVRANLDDGALVTVEPKPKTSRSKANTQTQESKS